MALAQLGLVQPYPIVALGRLSDDQKHPPYLMLELAMFT